MAIEGRLDFSSFPMAKHLKQCTTHTTVHDVPVSLLHGASV